MIDLKDMMLKELSDFCGIHTFSGCEYKTDIVKNEYGYEEDCGVGIFVLDNVCYAAIENPDDGYRSYLDGIAVLTELPRFEFSAIPVFCHMDENPHNNILFVRNAKTGNIVLKVGTIEVDDYYPCYRFEYSPENIGECDFEHKPEKIGTCGRDC